MANKTKSPVNKLREEWKTINWRKVEKYVFKLQKRIYNASRRGDIKQVRKLQKTLMKSWSNRVIAVRRVTQDNRGKNTAGVDGIKTLSPAARIKLAESLKLTGKSQPTRRVWIPKPGKDEKRPLGIPTMHDRALQGVVKNALEPEWEAKFEPNSYGFRPGRCAQDAIKQIKLSIQCKSKYVLDADIAKCFDRINHLELLRKIGQKGIVRKQIKSWLKSGVVDGVTYADTSEGTPQGGVISPLLANIALHEMENMLKKYIEGVKLKSPNGSYRSKKEKRKSLGVIRYADDFVVMHESKEVVQRCRELISEWLKDIGLELKPSKTRFTHTLLKEESEDGISGFNFLGNNIRQFKAGKSVSARNSKKEVLGFNTYIVPTKEAIKKHINDIREAIATHKSSPQIALIERLNSIIRGWCGYYKVSDSQTRGIMSGVEHTLYLMLRKWAKRRCGTAKKSIQYWHKHGDNNWVFSTRSQKDGGYRLLSHGKDFSYSVKSYVKVIGVVSPFDGNQTYWATRKGSHPELTTRLATLLKRDKGKCALCGLTFRDEDVIEVDHIQAKAVGGKDFYKNLQLLHGHCHDEKTRKDLEQIKLSKQDFWSSFYRQVNYKWVDDMLVFEDDWIKDEKVIKNKGKRKSSNKYVTERKTQAEIEKEIREEKEKIFRFTKRKFIELEKMVEELGGIENYYIVFMEDKVGYKGYCKTDPKVILYNAIIKSENGYYNKIYKGGVEIKDFLKRESKRLYKYLTDDIKIEEYKRVRQ